MKSILLFTIVAGTIIAAQEVPSREDQIAGAVLAAPAEFREDATVYGFDANGKLITLREGSNSMICLADDPAKPGFNAAAYHKDLDPFMARGRELRAEGKTSQEIFDIREAEAKNGTLKMPKDGATLHVLFGDEAKYDPASGEVLNARYRYVVYMPWATTEATGIPAAPTAAGGPWLMDPGTHRAHIMITPPAATPE